MILQGGSIMSREYWVIAVLAIASILLLTVFGCKGKLRENLFLLLVAQSLCWPATILLVFAGRIESPIRLFPKATDSNFMLAFVFLPALFVAYYCHYPRHKCRILQIVYTLAVVSGIALIHVALQKYTDLLKYITFSGYKFWLINVIVYYVARVYSDWYFRQLAKERSGNPR